jgi:hypothetical protein
MSLVTMMFYSRSSVQFSFFIFVLSQLTSGQLINTKNSNSNFFQIKFDILKISKCRGVEKL